MTYVWIDPYGHVYIYHMLQDPQAQDRLIEALPLLGDPGLAQAAARVIDARTFIGSQALTIEDLHRARRRFLSNGLATMTEEMYEVYHTHGGHKKKHPLDVLAEAEGKLMP